MRKRLEEILQSLLKYKNENNSITSIKRRYQVSERTIRNDLVEINEFLRNLHISDISIGTDGFLHTGPDFDITLVEEELTKMDTYFYKLSPAERQIYITLRLLWEQKHIVMKHIADELYVTRITILNDFEAIKEDLETKGIQIISDAGKGVYVECKKEERVSLLMDVLQKLMLDVENEGFFQRFVLRQLHIRYTFSSICSCAQEYLSINNLVFIDDALYTTVLYHFIIFNLLSDKQQAIVNHLDFNEIDNLMIYIGYKLNCTVSEEMLLDFRSYIKDNNISLYIKSLDEIELYEIITHFLSNIDQDLKFTLSQDNILISSLLLHIKNMRDWGDLEFEFSEMNEIVFDYQKLLSVVDKNLYVLEKYLTYHINENMKKSIMIHICVALLRGNKKAIRPSVVLVCPGSMATGKYLEAQIKNYFDFNILGLFPASKIAEQLTNMDSVDFVISTVQLLDIQEKCLKVHVVLTMQDMNLIQKTAFECQNEQSKKRKPKEKSKKAVHNLSSLLQEKDLPDSLYLKIESLISEYENEGIEELSAIGELLDKDNIIFCDEEIDWETSIRMAADKLMTKEYIGPRFVEKAIQNIKEYGDYIILGNGVALAHAGKDFDVYKDGLSLLVSHPGVIFSDGDRKVNFLFCFSSRGVKDHIELFNEIVEIGQNDDDRNRLLQMNEEEIYKDLCFK